MLDSDWSKYVDFIFYNSRQVYTSALVLIIYHLNEKNIKMWGSMLDLERDCSPVYKARSVKT